MSSGIKKRRADEEDEDSSAPGSSNKRIVHRLLSFSHGSRKQSRKTTDASSNLKVVFVDLPLEDAKPPPYDNAEARPGMGLLQGITRGSIANMVLARVGKLNPSELLGPPPSSSMSTLTKTVTMDPASAVARPTVHHESETAAAPPVPDPEHDEDEPREDGGANAASSSTPVVPPQEVFFYDNVRSQSPTVSPAKVSSHIYLVRTGPHAGVRGNLRPLDGAPGFSMLQTEDGCVVTVPNAHVTKTTAALPGHVSAPKRKLRNKDKKLFVENVKRLIAKDYERKPARAPGGGPPRPWYYARGSVAHNAVRVAMKTLDPKRERVLTARPK